LPYHSVEQNEAEMYGDGGPDGAMLTGVFPFGARLLARSPAADGPRPWFVLGAYPSALHVRWTPPPGLGRAIKALAVDNEPAPFWDGRDEGSRVDAWRSTVGWLDDWGVAESVQALNGSSGRRLDEEILRPLGASWSDVWCTDCLDTYYLSEGMRRAIREVYDPFAARLGLPSVELPPHPTSRAIVRGAQVERIGRELETADPEFVVTLGEAALKVLRTIVGDGPPDLERSGTYGDPASVPFRGRALRWYALIHPGQRGVAWRQTHESWIQRTMRSAGIL
jgi:hypothetical protein